MITMNEYESIMEDHGMSVRLGTHGMIEDVMISVYQKKGGFVILWSDIGYDEEGEFTNFVNSSEVYEDKEKFIKAIERLKMKYKTLKIQEKLDRIEKVFG